MTSPPKKPLKLKKRTEEYYRKKAVIIAKKICRISANYKCAYCGEGEPKYRTHGSHIYGEGTHKGMSAELKNLLCLCAIHHIGGFWKNATEPSWHEDPMFMTGWFKKTYPERAEELRIMSQHPIKIESWEVKLKELKIKLKKLLENL